MNDDEIKEANAEVDLEVAKKKNLLPSRSPKAGGVIQEVPHLTGGQCGEAIQPLFSLAHSCLYFDSF